MAWLDGWLKHDVDGVLRGIAFEVDNGIGIMWVDMNHFTLGEFR